MGGDIHCHVESIAPDGSWRRVVGSFGEDGEPFGWRSYAAFGWLAGVRNYSAVPPIAAPRGLPGDVSRETANARDRWGVDGHTESWLSVDELLAFNYDAPVEDRRVTRQMSANSWDGGCTADPGGGTMKTYREFLGPSFFLDLGELETLNSQSKTRIVFWFDN